VLGAPVDAAGASGNALSHTGGNSNANSNSNSRNHIQDTITKYDTSAATQAAIRAAFAAVVDPVGAWSLEGGQEQNPGSHFSLLFGFGGEGSMSVLVSSGGDGVRGCSNGAMRVRWRRQATSGSRYAAELLWGIIPPRVPHRARG
jgi:hypothetical protein